jgi:hypothetical protein
LAAPGAPGLARRFNLHDHLPLLVLSAHVLVAAIAKPIIQPTGGPADSSVSGIVDTTPDGIRMSASGNATPRFAGGTVFVEHGFLLQPMVLGCRCEYEGACNLAQLRANEHGLDTEDGSFAIGTAPNPRSKPDTMTISMVAHELHSWRLRQAIVAGPLNGSFEREVLELF